LREISDLAMARPGTIRLELGQPDFATPPHIAAAGKRAIDEGWTAYTQTAGLPALRERLAWKLKTVNGISASPSSIVCGPGGAGVISATVATLCNPGDEILIPDPHWPTYNLMAAGYGATAAWYPCPPELGYLPDLDRLESLITSRTRLLIINSPSNPTGAVAPPEMLSALSAIAERHNLWLLSDECYDQIVLNGEAVAPSMAAFANPERTVCAFTFSKTYAMTGWRLGYAVAPGSLVSGLIKVLESNTTCPSSIAQKAGEAALDGPLEPVNAMISAYCRRRDLVVDILRDAECLLGIPEGAFYVLADISPTGLSSRTFALRLLDEAGVSVAPGSAFGSVAAGAVRISLTSSDDDLLEGVGRLCQLVADTA
jgi:aspartate aminotransferase